MGLPNWREPVIPLSYVQVVRDVGGALSSDSQAAVERFARYLVALQRSPHTVRLYLGAVERWLAAGGEPGHADGGRLAGNTAVMSACRPGFQPPGNGVLRAGAAVCTDALHS